MLCDHRNRLLGGAGTVYAGSVEFEWDSEKADSNLQKHGVSFDEAATAFGDPLSLTISDPDHSSEEDRFVLMGETYARRLIVVVFTERGERSGSSALGLPRGGRGVLMKADRSENEMREEYDFSRGVRGKYADRFEEGLNVVVLDPDVAAAFTTGSE